jgi:hypothetical protein
MFNLKIEPKILVKVDDIYANGIKVLFGKIKL